MGHVPTQVKRRLYGTILLLGGVANTAGLATYLEWRISALWKLAPDSTEVVVVVPALTVARSVVEAVLRYQSLNRKI